MPRLFFGILAFCAGGTRLRRPEEPGGGASSRNPGPGSPGTSHPLLWDTVRTPIHPKGIHNWGLFSKFNFNCSSFNFQFLDLDLAILASGTRLWSPKEPGCGAPRNPGGPGEPVPPRNPGPGSPDPSHRCYWNLVRTPIHPEGIHNWGKNIRNRTSKRNPKSQSIVPGRVFFTSKNT